MIDKKRRLREEVLKKRGAISTANRVLHSATILERIFGLKEMESARWVAFYASYGSEVETTGMMAHALAHGKRIAVPKVDGERGMKFSELTHPVRELRPGYRNIPEPRPEFFRPVEVSTMNLLIVPGIAYDEAGNRLGQGAGFYDRLLGELAGRIPIIAPAFEAQVVPEVPVGPGDHKVDTLVTEKRVIECKKRMP
jgi:5-formyltetrahydrofolate cyclo-ligase